MSLPQIEVGFEAAVKVYFCQSCGGKRVGEATGLMIHLMDRHGMDFKTANEYRAEINSRDEVVHLEKEIEEEQKQKIEANKEKQRIKWAK